MTVSENVLQRCTTTTNKPHEALCRLCRRNILKLSFAEFLIIQLSLLPVLFPSPCNTSIPPFYLLINCLVMFIWREISCIKCLFVFYYRCVNPYWSVNNDSRITEMVCGVQLDTLFGPSSSLSSPHSPSPSPSSLSTSSSPSPYSSPPSVFNFLCVPTPFPPAPNNFLLPHCFPFPSSQANLRTLTLFHCYY